MAWTELKFQTIAQQANRLTDTLTELGALAVTLQDAGDQPLYEPDPGTIPLWDAVVITGLFDTSTDIQDILIAIKSEFPDLKPCLYQLDNQDWEHIWMDDFQPMQFGKRLWIIPSYQTQTFSHHQVVLDPGLAFGTGKHPTTALCLQWLDKNIKGGEIIIDYGCGSGILGIAALKLGAQKVYAIDHDPQAIVATKENGKRNGLTQEKIVLLVPTQYQQQQGDILVANILANPLIELAEKFNNMLPSKGKIVLSGILNEQKNDVIQAYRPYFEIVHVAQLEGWVRIDGYKTYL